MESLEARKQRCLHDAFRAMPRADQDAVRKVFSVAWDLWVALKAAEGEFTREGIRGHMMGLAWHGCRAKEVTCDEVCLTLVVNVILRDA